MCLCEQAQMCVRQSSQRSKKRSSQFLELQLQVIPSHERRCWETKLQTNERASPLGGCVTSPGLYSGSKTGPDPVRNSAGLVGIQNSLSPALFYIC